MKRHHLAALVVVTAAGCFAAGFLVGHVPDRRQAAAPPVAWAEEFIPPGQLPLIPTPDHSLERPRPEPAKIRVQALRWVIADKDQPSGWQPLDWTAVRGEESRRD